MSEMASIGQHPAAVNLACSDCQARKRKMR